VAWRVVSADGHPIHGAFQFSVGKRTVVDSEVVDRAFGAGGDRRDEVIAAVLRAISYGAVLVVAGAVLVGTRLGRADEPSPVSRRLGVLAGVGGVGVVVPSAGAGIAGHRARLGIGDRGRSPRSIVG
jgi:hypothetical protein